MWVCKCVSKYVFLCKYACARVWAFVAQALADLAHFVAAAIGVGTPSKPANGPWLPSHRSGPLPTYDLSDTSEHKWIAFGSSYAGALAAFLRAKVHILLMFASAQRHR
jgi:hypothetical protein